MPDVVVVGGGLIGLLTATELAERGASVLVLEKDEVGFEQSGRSVAAVNLPGGSPNGGPGSMLRACADEWATFEARWGCRIDVNAEGWHIVVADERDEEWMEIDRQTWNETAGYPDSETLDVDSARERFPSLQGPFRSLEVRNGGHVDATLVMRGLTEAAVRLGVEIRPGTLVTGFDVHDGELAAVRTGAGLVACGTVIVAAGRSRAQELSRAASGRGDPAGRRGEATTRPPPRSPCHTRRAPHRSAQRRAPRRARRSP